MIHLFIQKKTKYYHIMVLLAAALLLTLTGCAPEEKTLLLPESQPSEEEPESADPAKDFSVKKIYAYTYETWNQPDKTAYLQGCDENEIHITALDEREINEKLVYREVDYRYGFYDTVGEFSSFWEDWYYTRDGEMPEDLYVEQFLPSPDGTQMLLYMRSASWGAQFIYLYTLGSQEPWLLYESDTKMDTLLKGSFSPSGRWVTFDVKGTVLGPKHLVPVYDCHKKDYNEDQYWTLSSEDGAFNHCYPPDELLYTNIEPSESLWTADLCDFSGTDSPCLLSFIRDDYGRLSLQAEYRVISSTDDNSPPMPESGAGSENIPKAGTSMESENSTGAKATINVGYASGMDTGSNSDINPYMGNSRQLYLLGTDQNNENENEDIDAAAMNLSILESLDTSSFRHIAMTFEDFKDMPFFQYHYMETGNRLYYMGDSFQLFYKDLDALEQDCFRSFPEPVWDFLPMDSGDILVALIQASNTLPLEQYPGFIHNYYDEDSRTPLYILQSYWDIQSADLYLYPADGSDRILLYKNVQNLLNMEYDTQTRRVLLETFEDENLSHRRCIILEL